MLANPVGGVTERMNRPGMWGLSGSKRTYMITVVETSAVASSTYKDQPRTRVVYRTIVHLESKRVVANEAN